MITFNLGWMMNKSIHSGREHQFL